MRGRWAVAPLILLALLGSTADAGEVVQLLDVDILPPSATHWVGVLQFSDAGLELVGVDLDEARYYVDVSPATWSGSPVSRRSEGGVTAYRWAQFAPDPPVLRFAVEHQPGWRCSAAADRGTVTVSCRVAAPAAPQQGDPPVASPTATTAATTAAVGCEPVARARGIELCTPLRGLSGAELLARSLEYLPSDVIRDGLPHFGAQRDDWKGAARPHQGLDIYADGCDVLAMADGTVADIGRGEKAGGWIKLSHGRGVETVSVHVRSIFVHMGQMVSAGERIGRIDGPVGNAVEAQLHLELRLDGSAADPALFFEEASPAELSAAWRQAIEAIPQRVDSRRRLLADYERTPEAPATTDSSHAQTRAP